MTQIAIFMVPKPPCLNWLVCLFCWPAMSYFCADFNNKKVSKCSGEHAPSKNKKCS